MTRALIAKVHIAKKELALDDETYRDVLERVTKKRSASGLREWQLKKVLDEFKRLGWVPEKPEPKRSGNPQVRMIFSLWGILADGGAVRSRTKTAVRAYVKRMTAVDNPEWLSIRDANKVIEALKQWIIRAGLEDKLEK